MSDLENNYTDSENEEELVKIIKDRYSLKDFLKHPIIGGILVENAIQTYENTAEKEIENFYKEEVDFCNNSGATIFNNEIDFAHRGDLMKIIFRNIRLKYNENILYNDPDLVKEFVDYEAKKYEGES